MLRLPMRPSRVSLLVLACFALAALL